MLPAHSPEFLYLTGSPINGKYIRAGLPVKITISYLDIPDLAEIKLLAGNGA